MWQSLPGPEEIIVIFLGAAAFKTLSGPRPVQERKKSQHTLAAKNSACNGGRFRLGGK